MKDRSLRSQLIAIFIGFLLLVLGSAALTFWLVHTQQNDAVIINLAGRQRMLAQQMVRLALTEPASPELASTIAHFEQTLTVLLEGGDIVSRDGPNLILPPTTNPGIRSQLQDVAAIWPAFQDRLRAPVDGDALRADFTTLLARLDQIVDAYEADAQAKIARLRQAQLIFLGAAFLLLAWGYRITRRNLIRPLATLDAAARQMGAGRLDSSFSTLPPNELGRLGQTMEKMQAEIAAHQGLLEQRVEQRVQELTAVLEFSREIVRELEPDQLLRSVARHARDLIQGEASAVCVLDTEGRTLELVAGSGAGEGHLGLRQPLARDPALPVVRERQTVIAAGGCAGCGFLHQFSDASCMATPLQVGGRSLGALCVVRPQRPFDADEARAITLLANAAAVALENARLIEDGKRQVEENALLAERERLAAELHDNLAQTLGAAQFSVDRLARTLQPHGNEQAQARLVEIQSTLQEAYAQVRVALTGLREAAPDEGAFMARVRALLADFEAQTGVPARLAGDEEESLGLSAVTQKQALYILGEALTNVRRHAQANRVQLTIHREPDVVSFVISDDGCGFHPEMVNSQNHLGLAIMRARASRSQGRLDIRSAPGQGTQIRATFPVRVGAGPVPEAA